MNLRSKIVGISLCAAVFCFVLAGCSSTSKVGVKPNEHMEVGWTPRTVFQSPSYAAWFDTGYGKYQPHQESIERLKKMQDSVAIGVVYGTWCSDSKREIPRFLKIMDLVGFPQDRITLIAVDRTMQVPSGIAGEYRITNVPTFMVRYRGLEIGRIVESPHKTLEEDLLDVLAPLFP